MTKYKKHTLSGKLVGGPLLNKDVFETIQSKKLTLKASKKNKKFTALAEDDEPKDEE